MMMRRSEGLISAKLMSSSAQLMSSMFLVLFRYIEAFQSIDVCPKTIKMDRHRRQQTTPLAGLTGRRQRYILARCI
jgi:hypothetical protein